MRAFSVFMTGLLFILGSAPAFCEVGGGSEAGNGGEDISLQFMASYEAARNNMTESRDSRFEAALQLEIAKVLPNLKVISVPDILTVEVSGVLQDVVALNFRGNQLIKVNRDRWSAIEDPHVREGISLHEVLSLVGIEGTGDYRISAVYVARFGLSPEVLRQGFSFVVERASYKSGEDVYAIEARERWLKDPVGFAQTRIEYTVTINGKPIQEEFNKSGILYSCVTGEFGEGAKLPSGFVEVLSAGGRNFGFAIKGGGVCGNTYSDRFQFVIPLRTTVVGYYLFKEVVAKRGYAARYEDGELSIWYFTQEWGSGGTAGSFFVPRRLVFDPTKTYYGLRRGKLPKDLKRFPVFERYSFNDFPSLYVAGLTTHDGEMMEYSLNYFREDADSLGWYGWMGVPTSYKEAARKARAMKELGDSLDLFDR